MGARPTKLYLAIAVIVLVAILFTVILIVYMRGGDPAAPVGVAVVATAAAIAASRSRETSLQKIEDAKAVAIQAAKTIEDNQVAADTASAAVPGQVAAMTDDELKDEGNWQFGRPPGST